MPAKQSSSHTRLSAEVDGPYVLIPGARVRTMKDVEGLKEAILAMRAAIEVGAYETAELIRRKHLLFACALCADHKLRGSGERWVKVDSFGSDGMLICWSCIKVRIGSAMPHHSRTGKLIHHSCYLIDGIGNVPRRWSCELR